jgi:hypothetical protein
LSWEILITEDRFVARSFSDGSILCRAQPHTILSCPIILISFLLYLAGAIVARERLHYFVEMILVTVGMTYSTGKPFSSQSVFRPYFNASLSNIAYIAAIRTSLYKRKVVSSSLAFKSRVFLILDAEHKTDSLLPHSMLAQSPGSRFFLIQTTQH